MPDRPPVERRTVSYWRDDRIEKGCISERIDIPAPPAAEQLDTAAERFEDRLLDAGLPFEQAELAARIFEEFCDDLAAAKAADAVREILLQLSVTRTGKTPEFRAILSIFSPGRTVEDVAGEAGLSRQSVSYHLDKLKPIFAFDPACAEGV